MAHMTQEQKKEIAERCKPILKKYGLKASFSVRDYNKIVLTIKSGTVDFKGNYNKNWESDVKRENREQLWGTIAPKFGDSKAIQLLQLEPYGIPEYFTGDARKALLELGEIIQRDNYDHSDVTTDYFDTGYYAEINIGTPYEKAYFLEII